MKAMKKLLLTTICIFGLTFGANAQTKTGYEKSVEVGTAIGIDKYRNNTYSISMVNGYRLNQYLFFGVGVSVGYSNAISLVKIEDVKVLDISYRTEKILRHKSLPIPVFLSAKYNFIKAGTLSPFLRLNAGYTFDAFQDIKDAPGITLEPSVGLDMSITDKLSLYAAIGFNMQQQNVSMIKNVGKMEDWKIGDERMMLNSISVRAGVTF